MKNTNDLLLYPTFYLTTGVAILAITSVWLLWPAPYMYVLPAAFIAVAVIDFFVRLDQRGRGKTTIKAKPKNTHLAPQAKPTSAMIQPPVAVQTPSSAPPSAIQLLAPAAPEKKKDEKKSNSTVNHLIGYAIWLVLVVIVIKGLFWIADLFEANTRYAIAHDPGIQVVNALPFNFHYNQKVDIQRYVKLRPGEVKDVFTLDSGQFWRAYVLKNIEYRVKATGDEPFTALPRRFDYAYELPAERTGTLQFRATRENARIETYRLVPYANK